MRMNDTYFGGRYFEAEGWATKTCQVCSRHVVKGGSVHHVLGHPDHSRLVYMCQGCHELVGTLSRRENINLEKLILFTFMQRSSYAGWRVKVEVVLDASLV
jgi:hypothetical protein